jgi:hypothetical protein
MVILVDRSKKYFNLLNFSLPSPYLIHTVACFKPLGIDKKFPENEFGELKTGWSL